MAEWALLHLTQAVTAVKATTQLNQIVRSVEAPWRDDFRTCYETGEASAEFEAILDKRPDLQAHFESALELQAAGLESAVSALLAGASGRTSFLTVPDRLRILWGKLARFVTRRRVPTPTERASQRTSRPASGDVDGAARCDPLIDGAVRVVFESGSASAALLERRLPIDRQRASILIGQMVAAGILEERGDTREVLITLDEWEQVQLQQETVGRARQRALAPVD